MVTPASLLTDDESAQAVAAMTERFAAGDLAGGLNRGIELLGETRQGLTGDTTPARTTARHPEGCRAVLRPGRLSVSAARRAPARPAPGRRRRGPRARSAPRPG
ncbi:hypothetical protein G5V59_09150 [Nocardioides sp. W3-2-3]|nr:hypothetical protein [Nocardioides convexus]